MARREYRPYPTRKQMKNRRLRTVALILIVLIAGVIILIQTNKSNEPAAEPKAAEGPRKMVLDDILPAQPQSPAKAPDKLPAQPQIVTNPAVAAPKPAEPKAAEPKPAAPVSTPAPAPAVVSTPPQTTRPETLPVSEITTADNQTSPQATELINQAVQLRDKEGKIIAARELLNSALKMQLSPSVRAMVKQTLSKLADTWLFESEVYADDKLTSYYVVQPGDLLEKIGKQYKVPYEVIMQINGIVRPELLRAGQKIKVIDGPFNAIVYKSSYTMDLYLQTKYIKTYRVGLGRDSFETPTGRWRVASGGKMIRPTWTDPDSGRTYDGLDPDYPLGSRWIGLEGIEGKAEGRTGFAIHGTKDEDSIGTRSSRGCIRLYNGDVIEIYDLMYPGISEVLVVE